MRAILTLAAALTATFPLSTQTEGAAARARFDWRIPIHANADGELWASGPSFKAQFGSAVTFVPIDPTTDASWTWRTRSIRRGATVLVDGDAESPADAETWADWRYERRLGGGGVRELWLVRADGIEQQFVLDERPAGRGDLVVVGDVRGLSTADVAEPRHGSLAFHDADGVATVGYGAAVAIAADGERLPVETSAVDGRVELRVDGAWLDGAAFPVVLDPLVLNTRITDGGGGAPQHVDLCAGPDGDRHLLIMSRQASASDFDFVAVELDGQMASLGVVIADLSILRSTRYAQCAVSEDISPNQTGVDRWIVAAQRDTTRFGVSRVYLLSQEFGMPFTGSWSGVPYQTGTSQRFPSVTGAVTGSLTLDDAVVVYQHDVGVPAQNTSASSIWSAAFDTISGQFGAPQRIAIGGATDNEWPSITRASDGSRIAVWQTRDNQRGGTWDVAVGLLSHPGRLVTSTTLAGSTSEHELRPVVAGFPGRFLVAFTRQELLPTTPTGADAGFAIDAHRMDVDLFSNTFRFGPRRTVATANGLPRVSTGSGSRGIAFDTLTASHWSIAYVRDGRLSGGTRDAEIVRVGYQAAITESAVLEQSAATQAFGPAVCFNTASEDFPVAWATTAAPTAAGFEVGVARFDYVFSLGLAYGGGCQGDLNGENFTVGYTPPRAGSEYYEISLTNGLPSASSWLFFGLDTSLNLQLSPGCLFYIGPTPWLYAATTTDALGRFTVETPFPDDPLIVDTFYWQAIQLNGATGALSTTNGFATQIR